MLKMSLDKVDVKILEILQEEGDISNVELSKKSVYHLHHV